ncbi:MAG: thiamine phosphate synthase [Pseudomonadota bacterium]
MKRKANVFTRGLYALTPTNRCGSALIDAASAALAGGTVWLQYRAKPEADRTTALALQQCCQATGALFIVNDDVELAVEIRADGVHLGRDDMSLIEARSMLHPDQLIGVSCYNDLARAAKLVEQGADYLAFGSLYPSPTKPDAVHCPLKTLTEARQFGKPVVAIGGITLERAPEVAEAGADLIAVISDLFDADDIEARARQWSSCF